MLKLLYLDETETGVQVAPEAIQIKEFEDLYKKAGPMPGDTQNRKKLRAKKLMAFIFYYCDIVESTFAGMEEEMKVEEICDALQLDEDPRQDPLVQAAMERYRKMNTTKLESLLESSYMAIDSLENFYRTVDLEMSEDPASDATKLINSLAKLGNVVDSIGKLIEQIQKQRSTGSKLRRGVEVTEFSQ